jgi:hypothetical protein
MTTGAGATRALGTGESASAAWRNRGSRDAQRYAGLSGLAFVVLFGGGSALWGLEMPDAGAPVAEIVEFYRDTSGRIVARVDMP